MNEIKGILSNGETAVVNKLEALKGIGENIQPVPFALEEYHGDIEHLLGYHCDFQHPGKHCPHEDLMSELIEAMEDLTSQDLQYMESLEESSDDIFSRTVSYLCVPLALMDMLRAFRHVDSNRKLARAVRAYQRYMVALIKDLEIQIDEKLLVRAFQGDNYSLAADGNNDWLLNALMSELRQAKTASHLDMAQFVGLVLNEAGAGKEFRSKIIQGFAERQVKNRLTTRIGANKAKSRVLAVQSFSAMQSTMRLDPFSSFVASNSAKQQGLLNDFIDYLADWAEPVNVITRSPEGATS